MFFYISETPNKDFFNHTQVNNLWISYDNGWQLINDKYLFKGYTDNEIHVTEVCNANSSLAGNYCVLDFSDNTTIKIKHSLHRSFPIFYDHNCLTNLDILDRSIGAENSCLVLTDNFTVQISDSNKINYVFENLTESQVVDNIDNILNNKVKNFVDQNNGRLKVFLSGGIDSMLVYSYIKKYTDNYELLDYEHFEFDDFICKNKTKIKSNFWAYTQIHHWRTREILTSGAPGDEYMLRNPGIANLFLLHHKLDILDIVSKNSMHYSYYTQPKYLVEYKKTKSNKHLMLLVENKNLLYNHFCNLNLNDFQHWHLGNTLTYTPLRDIEIFINMLRLPLESALKQITDSKISKQLIARQDADLLNYISLQKNKEPLQNLCSLYKQHKNY